MKGLYIFIIVIGLTLSAQAAGNQKYLSYFSTQTIQTAHTALYENMLNTEEKEVVLWTNLVRIDPTNFSIMLRQYIQDHSGFQAKGMYEQSLMNDLKNSTVLNVLYATPLLTSNAKQHATYSQSTMKRGHDHFDQRAQLAFNEQYTAYGENCAYYVTDALHSVICLLVDKNVPDLGHRKIILDNNYNEIGVSVLPYHSNPYKVVIQEFGKSENAEYFAKKVYTPSVVQLETMVSPTPENIIVKNTSNIKEMYINGKYVKVDTSKYYSVSEYQQYVKDAQKLKTKNLQK